MKRCCPLVWLLPGLLLFLLGGCSLFGLDAGSNTDPYAAPPAGAGGDLSQFKSGPVVATVAHGPGNTTLLEDYVKTTKEILVHKQRAKELATELALLKVQLGECKGRLASETLLRKGSEAERDQANERLKETDAQILNLALAKTRTHKELVVLQIEHLRLKRDFQNYKKTHAEVIR